MKVKVFFQVILFVVLSVFLYACSLVNPITRNLIIEMGGDDEVGKFQYYLSTKIILNDARKIQDQQINKYGTATITNVVYKSRIIINKHTMGAVLNSSFDKDNNLQLEVCFENDDNKRIHFRQEGPGNDRKFYIVYTDVFKRIIEYGGESYVVDYSGTEKPYLKVKVYKQIKEQTKTRWLGGRRVQNK